ncbi:MAG: 50S ribosomal protein L18a [Methanomicrobiales archaeon]|nr:50S ribosomal protein L18a [Methanomicrobiales archaeon]
MADQTFTVQGTFFVGQKWHPYEKTVTAPNERVAVERIYTVLGSKHRLKRREITVTQVRPEAGDTGGAGRSA